ncbi:anti-sigma factor [Parendozoicomonas sp. Alg238-R29]|uniref:anti-sigma factor n=1 Tax=Parendozoicomonas sp. Alg238-R29 TaxID=2993446 RepID=UPI00248E3DCA|nr:anti-sigma factor [Parendozoicomonas sp. Alg238-R29]
MSEWNLSDPGDRNEAAAEYVLGLLPQTEKARFEALLAASHDAQQDVRNWQEHLNILNENLVPQQPPAKVWKEVSKATKPESFWSNLRFWQSASVSMALAVVFTVVLWFQSGVPGNGMDYVYVVQGPSEQTEWIVNASMNRDKVYVEAVQPVSLPDGKVCELWLMVAGREPVSLGILPKMGRNEVTISSEWREALKNSPLVITLEKPSGAPNGYEMGPVMNKGKWTPVNKASDYF